MRLGYLVLLLQIPCIQCRSQPRIWMRAALGLEPTHGAAKGCILKPKALHKDTCRYGRGQLLVLSKRIAVSITHRPCIITRVGQNRIYTPYMTVYLVISLFKIPYIHRIHRILANPNYNASWPRTRKRVAHGFESTQRMAKRPGI